MNISQMAMSVTMAATPKPPLTRFLHPSPKPHRSFIPNVTTDSDSGPEPQPEPQPDDFESRISRLKFRSGTGKKAEIRKQKKGKKGTTTTTGSGVFLPPVPLKEPVSGGLKVDFGFTPYSERLNGRLAGLGLAALLLVELGTGRSTLRFHTPAIVFVQIYFMAAATGLYCKFEKEKVSIWPQIQSSSSSSNDE